MSIRFSDVVEQYDSSSIKVLTNAESLDNEIRSVGLLEYEPVERVYDQIFEGDLVLSSLLFARDNPEILKNAIHDLADIKVSALGIKEVYYSSIPEDLIEYANNHHLTIFVYKRAVFTESIILTVASLLEDDELNQEKYILTEKLLEETDKLESERLALEINPLFPKKTVVFYFDIPTHAGKLFQFVKKIESSSIVNDSSSIYNYKDGIIAIIDYAHLGMNPWTIAKSLQSQGLPWLSDCAIGISNYIEQLHDLGKGIQQAIYASKTTSNTSKIRRYSDLGFDKILYPYLDDYWMNDYSKDIIATLKSDDQKTGGNLLETAFCFFKNHQDLKKTSKEMYQHENTIRYRIQKIRDLLDDPNLVQLNIAIRIYQLKNRS